MSYVDQPVAVGPDAAKLDQESGQRFGLGMVQNSCFCFFLPKQCSKTQIDVFPKNFYYSFLEWRFYTYPPGPKEQKPC